MSLTSASAVSSFVSSQELVASGAVVFDILERFYAEGYGSTATAQEDTKNA